MLGRRVSLGVWVGSTVGASVGVSVGVWVGVYVGVGVTVEVPTGRSASLSLSPVESELSEAAAAPTATIATHKGIRSVLKKNDDHALREGAPEADTREEYPVEARVSRTTRRRAMMPLGARNAGIGERVNRRRYLIAIGMNST